MSARCPHFLAATTWTSYGLNTIGNDHNKGILVLIPKPIWLLHPPIQRPLVTSVDVTFPGFLSTVCGLCCGPFFPWVSTRLTLRVSHFSIHVLGSLCRLPAFRLCVDVIRTLSFTLFFALQAPLRPPNSCPHPVYVLALPRSSYSAQLPLAPCGYSNPNSFKKMYHTKF